MTGFARQALASQGLAQAGEAREECERERLLCVDVRAYGTAEQRCGECRSSASASGCCACLRNHCLRIVLATAPRGMRPSSLCLRRTLRCLIHSCSFGLLGSKRNVLGQHIVVSRHTGRCDIVLCACVHTCVCVWSSASVRQHGFVARACMSMRARVSA